MKEVIHIQKITTLAHLVRQDQNAQYDALAKEILSYRWLQAGILKDVVVELKDYSIPEIMSFIDPMSIEVGSHPLDKFIGSRNESTIPEEGSILYDLRYNVYIPTKEETIKIIVNVEAQKDIPKEYSLITRGIYYCARLISEQKNTEFKKSDYNQLKKVYSIWIVMNPNKKEENKIERYYMTSNRKDKKEEYDKLEIILINLGETISNQDGILQELGVIFSRKIEQEERDIILKKRYNRVVDKKDKEALTDMCNLSLGIEERGIERGIKQGLEQGLEQGIAIGSVNGQQLLLEKLLMKGAISEELAKEIRTEIEKEKQNLEVSK